MTRIRLAPLAAALLVSPLVHAQGVTVFGIADAAIRRVENQDRGSITSMVSGSNSTSRLGVRGTEDLGGGLFAGFHLEHGILFDVGNPVSATQFWDRRSTVSIGAKAWGEIRAGRDFVPSYNNWSRYDPFSYVGVAGANNFVNATPAGPIRSAFGSGGNTTVRSSNAVQWLLPQDLGGLNGEAMWAKREAGTAANGQHDLRGLRLGWAGKTFEVSAAATVTSNDLTQAIGSDFKDVALGGRVDFGVARVSTVLRRFSLASARQTQLLVGVWVPVGNGEIKASYNQADLSGSVGSTAIGANDARQFALGYVHTLSKRSVAYATLSRIDNRGAATYAVPGGPAGLAGGGRSTGVEFGVRHNF
ncbi:MAG: porin [Rubrivivax sp.]